METIRSRRAKVLPEELPPGISPGRRPGTQSAAQEIAAVDLAAEDDYWREHFSSRYYVEDEFKFEDYAPAYRLAAGGKAESTGMDARATCRPRRMGTMYGFAGSPDDR